MTCTCRPGEYYSPHVSRVAAGLAPDGVLSAARTHTESSAIFQLMAELQVLLSAPTVSAVKIAPGKKAPAMVLARERQNVLSSRPTLLAYYLSPFGRFLLFQPPPEAINLYQASEVDGKTRVFVTVALPRYGDDNCHCMGQRPLLLSQADVGYIVSRTVPIKFHALCVLYDTGVLLSAGSEIENPSEHGLRRD
ncbi:hypothetical protein Bbelb_286600 [Branchiostoma belcheri]|nr:hypothetical protein Bbelb_286600 [Branchiostoma belcheri]